MRATVRPLLIFCLILAALFALCATAFNTVFRNDLIIMLGIIVANMVTVASAVLALLAFGAALAQLVLGLLRKSRDQAKLRAAAIPNYASLSEAERNDPAVITRELQNIRLSRPTLDGEIAAALDCLQQADNKQARIHELQKLNPNRNLDQVVRTIDDAELAIAKNTTKILNMLTIWDPREALRPEKAQIYNMNREYIHTNLQKNRQITDQADMLLHTVVKFVCSSGKEDSMLANIDSLNQALASLLQQYDSFSSNITGGSGFAGGSGSGSVIGSGSGSGSGSGFAGGNGSGFAGGSGLASGSGFTGGNNSNSN
jgi:hypothetical protein